LGILGLCKPRPFDLILDMRIAFVFSLVAVAAFSTGCASMRTGQTTINELPKDVPEVGYQPSAHYGNVNLDQNEKVDQWLKYFTGRGRRHMHIYLERSARYIPMMKATFRERGMPEELTYIAMIESGFSSSAFSHASAVGYWQFIRETGKRYNLRIDNYVDERRDPILSTQSAANYMDSLFSLFGDWHLALSGYNAGERRIQNAVMKHRTRDFWHLARIRKGLPKETANYIPKYIAAVMIAKDPAKYGFNDIDFQPAFSFDSVIIDKPISLELLAKEINVDFAEMKRMNPRYKSDYVPVYSDRINAVRVPVGMKELAVAAIPKSLSDAPKRYVASFEYHKVRRGETLSHIARKYRTSIAKLRDLNDFSKRSILRIGQRIKVPDPSGGVSVRQPSGKPQIDESSKKKFSKSKSTQIAKNKKTAPKKTTHVVRRGENLSTIARKYQVSVAQIAKLNSLQNKSRLFVGTQLVIPE